MTKPSSLINDVLAVLSNGYRPYRGEVQGEVYERLRCNKPDRATWFEQERKFLCLGCKRRCALVNPSGMQLTVPVDTKPSFGRVLVAELPSLTVGELLATGRPLRPDEAAYVLNVSEREIYDLEVEGRLQRAGRGRPLRVTSDSVAEELAGRD